MTTSFSYGTWIFMMFSTLWIRIEIIRFLKLNHYIDLRTLIKYVLRSNKKVKNCEVKR